MTDPQWTVEFSVQDNKTKARHEVRIEAPELVDGFLGAVQGMAAVIGGDAQRKIAEAFGKLSPELRGMLTPRGAHPDA